MFLVSGIAKGFITGWLSWNVEGSVAIDDGRSP